VGKAPAELQIKDENPHELAIQMEGFQPVKQTVDSKTATPLTLKL